MAEAYTSTDLEEPDIRYAYTGVPDYIQSHEDAIDTALEENPDLMIFPTTLEEAGEVLEPGEGGRE